MIGIYKITNNFNRKVYIGQSNDIGRRHKQHWIALLKNKHNNRALQIDFNKYKNYFNFSVLERCEEKNLNERELFWINFYNATNNEYGYNHSTSPYKRKNKNLISAKKYKHTARYKRKKI